MHHHRALVSLFETPDGAIGMCSACCAPGNLLDVVPADSLERVSQEGLHKNQDPSCGDAMNIDSLMRPWVEELSCRDLPFCQYVKALRPHGERQHLLLLFALGLLFS